MKIYKCPRCGRKYRESELVKTKCSENEVGWEIVKLCPKCIRKRKPEVVELEEVKKED